MISYQDFNEAGGKFGKPVTIYGLSTDEKPTTCMNGSVFIEMDTDSIYFYDQANNTWRMWGDD